MVNHHVCLVCPLKCPWNSWVLSSQFSFSRDFIFFLCLFSCFPIKIIFCNTDPPFPVVNNGSSAPGSYIHFGWSKKRRPFSRAGRNQAPGWGMCSSGIETPWHGWFMPLSKTYLLLVGGLTSWNMNFMTFHMLGISYIPNWRTHIFQRGWNHQPVFVYLSKTY